MKRLFVLICIFICLTAIHVSATDIIIDGTKVEFNQSSGYPFINQDNRTMVPLRATMEAYGAEVRWDSEQNTAIVAKGVTTVTCKIGEDCVYRNGTKIPNDASATIVNGRTYLPIRAVLEALDAEVGWDGNVLVSSPGAADVIYNIEHSDSHVSNMWAEWQNALKLKQNGNYAECIEKIKQLAPDFLKASDDNSDAMLFNHLGECYSKLGMVEEAAAAYTREGEKWETAGLPQASIAAFRKASLTQSTVQMFATTSNKAYSANRYNGVAYEPENGIFLGVTLKHSDSRYMDEFPVTAGKDMAGFLIYADVGSSIDTYKSVFSEAKKQDYIVQLSLQPGNIEKLKNITKSDPKYIAIAQTIESYGAKTLVRFACEMNDETSKWYTDDYDMYIEKFRYVADIFHEYAPSCAVVWSPNFYPSNNMEFYYPGDEYVDYVGISAYAEYAPETDPLGLGVDRNRFAAVLDRIVSLYGHKKPIIISECGSSYVYTRTGADITNFASTSLRDFYTYLPIKYPQVKMVFLFETVDAGGRRFELSGNSVYKNAYAESIKSPFYLSTPSQKQTIGIYPLELGNNVSLPAEKVTLHSYIKTLENDIAYTVYRINGTDVGVSYGIPYSVECDLSSYSGQTVTITCTSYDSNGAPCAVKSYKIKVD